MRMNNCRYRRLRLRELREDPASLRRPAKHQFLDLPKPVKDAALEPAKVLVRAGAKMCMDSYMLSHLDVWRCMKAEGYTCNDGKKIRPPTAT